MELKTTITPDDGLWKSFQAKVIEEEGQARRLNAVISELIRGYVEGRFVVDAGT